MVHATRQLESALGDGSKQIEANERETVVVQRRCVRAARNLPSGTVLSREDVQVLRPAPVEAIPAHEVTAVVGRRLRESLAAGQDVRWSDLA